MDDRIKLKNLARPHDFECTKCRMRMPKRICSRCGGLTRVIEGREMLVEVAEAAAKAYADAVKLGPDGLPQHAGEGEV